MDKVIDWLTASTLLDGNPNWALLVVALVLLVSAYVARTETPDDDAWFQKWIQLFSVLVPKDAPGTLKWLFTVVTKPKPEADDAEETKP